MTQYRIYDLHQARLNGKDATLFKVDELVNDEGKDEWHYYGTFDRDGIIKRPSTILRNIENGIIEI